MTPEKAYRAQRANARYRGIAFDLTFDQWWSIWEESGHWRKRGRGRDKFVMARYGDEGPYCIGNVRIITNQENSLEALPKVQTAQKKRWARLTSAERSQVNRDNMLKVPMEKRRANGLKAAQAGIAKRKADPELAISYGNKVSLALKGKPFTPEHRANLAAVNKRRGAEMTAARLKRERG